MLNIRSATKLSGHEVDELEKIRRQNRRLLIVLSFFILLILTGLVASYFRPSQPTVKNYIGKNGQNGKDAEVDYSVLFNLIDSRIAALPTPENGRDGRDGQIGPQGPQGPAGADSLVPGPQGEKGEASTVPGPKGDTGDAGAPARDVEFSCEPTTHDYRWRYVGDEDWKVLQANSKACTENE